MRGYLEAGWCDDGWLTPPPSPSLSHTKLPIPLSLPHKIINPSTHKILPLSSMFFQLSHQTCYLFSFHVYRIWIHMHLTYITCLHLSHRPNFFLSLSLSLSLSLCFVRFVSYSLIHIHTIFPAPSAPSSQALYARFIHTLGYVQNVAFIMADVELLLVLLHPTK